MNCMITVPILAAFLAVASAVGGYGLVGVNSLNWPPPVIDALEFAVAQYNHKSNALYLVKVTRIKTAQQEVKQRMQMVEGVLITITVDMASTYCRKGTWCDASEDKAIGETKECTFKVWSHLSSNSMELTEDTCLA